MNILKIALILVICGSLFVVTSNILFVITININFLFSFKIPFNFALYFDCIVIREVPSALFLQELYLKQKKSLTSKLLKIILKLYFFLKRYFLKKPLKSRVLKYLTHYQRHIFLVTNFMYCINRTFTQTIHILDKCDGCEDDKC